MIEVLDDKTEHQPLNPFTPQTTALAFYCSVNTIKAKATTILPGARVHKHARHKIQRQKPPGTTLISMRRASGIYDTKPNLQQDTTSTPHHGCKTVERPLSGLRAAACSLRGGLLQAHRNATDYMKAPAATCALRS